MSKELTVNDWMDEISMGLEYRKKYGRESSWGDLEKMMDHQLNLDIDEGNPGPNIIMSNVDSLLASLNVNDPYMTARATKTSLLEKANVVENMANRTMRRMKLQKEIDACGVAAYLWSRSFIKIGYDSEFGFDPRFDTGVEVPLGTTMTQFDLKSKGLERIENLPTEPGMPWVRSVLPHDIVVPWGTRDLDDAPWIAHRILRHIDDIKADPKYENKKDLKAHVTIEDFVKSYERTLQVYRAGEGRELPWRPQQFTDKSKRQVEYVEMWEIHDRRTRKIMVITQNHQKFIRNEMDALQLRGKFPFTSLCFMPRTRKFWTTSDAYYLKFHQMELTDITVQKVKHRRLMVAKFLIDEDAMSEPALDQLLSPKVGAAVRLKGGSDRPISERVQLMNNQTPNLLLAQDEEMVRRNAREMMGFSRNQIGEYEQTGRRSATEAALVQQASDLRLDRRQKAVRDLYVETMEIVLSVIFKYQKIPRTVEILGQDGAQVFLNVNGEDLEGEYDYDMGFSTGGQESLQARRQQAIQFYMMASQDPLADPIAVRRYVVQAMNDPRFTQIFQGALSSGQAQQIPQGNPGQASFPGLPMGGGRSGTPSPTVRQG